MGDQEQQAKQLHALQENLVGLRDKGRSLWPAEAAILHEVKSTKGWTLLGADSFAEWLAQPEIAMSVSHANTLIGAYKTLVIDGDVELQDLSGLDPTKVREVLPAIRQGRVKAAEALSDVEVQSRSSLRTKYADPKKLKDKLDATAEPASCKCSECGHVHTPKEAS